MGQMTSSLEPGSGLEPGAGGCNVQLLQDDDDSSNSENSKRRMNSINCVKTKIDMLIEDCLNVKISANESDELNKTDNEKSEENEKSQSESSEVKDQINSDKNEGDKTEEEGSKTPINVNDNVGTPGSVKDQERSLNDGGAETKETIGVKDEEKGHSSSKDKDSLKITDLIEDMNTKTDQKSSKAVTTFQTFIDKVLDNSLIQVPVSEKVPTNFLKLCQDSIDTNAVKTDKLRNETETRPKFDKASTKIKPERKITLKDHIERFLETSLREETILCEKSDSQTEKRKDGSVTSKNGFPDNFYAQGLINNMITQGLQINKLLSPPLPVNHSKNPSKSPDIRLPDHSKQEYLKELRKKDVKSETQPNVSSKSEPGSGPGYLYHKSSVAAAGMPQGGHQLQQLSPGHVISHSQVNMAGHSRTKHVGKDMREHPMADHMAEYKAYEAARRDYPYGRHYPPDFPGEEHVQHTHAHLEHVGMMGARDTTNHGPHPHQMHPAVTGYPHTYSPRMVGATPYHPVVVPQHVEDQRGVRQPHHPLHHKDCICPSCVPHHRHALDHREIREQKKLEFQAKRRSPNLPPHMIQQDVHQRGHFGEPTPTMMRTSHMQYPPGTVSAASAYPNMPKLLPQQPPIASTKEYGQQLMVPGHGIVQGRRPSLPENPVPRQFMQQVDRRAEYSNTELAEEYSRRLDGFGRSNLSPFPVRPSSMPSNDHVDGSHGMPRSPAISEVVSRSSEASVDSPLDLSVKKVKVAMERPRSSSYSSGGQNNSAGQKKLNPPNTFLRHLENSVDKYCQEVISPEDNLGTRNSRPVPNRTVTPNDNKQNSVYPVQNPRQPSPHNMYNVHSHRKLPSPQFTGGITMGQPLVESRSQPVPRNGDYVMNSSPQNVANSTPQLNNSHSSLTTAQANFDANNKRNINSVSKHEPIQNIIGSHDPNDILYLICTVCTQTYGSPYGFRKHFRNQHGFEPRAEHTIVQTISATKSALHGPETKGTVVMADIGRTLTPPMSAAREECKNSGGNMASTEIPEIERNGCAESLYSRKCSSEAIGEVSEKTHTMGQTDKSDKFAQGEISERKCLECPECGKTFQLNDFGSYKRHCRQHNNIKVTGPYTCTDCHLSFPDQKALKEHYIFHVTESHNFSTDKSISRDISSCGKNSGICFACVKCDKQFDNITAYNNHIVVHEQPPELSPQISLQTNKESRANVSSASCSSVKHSLNVIPSRCIVKEAAESMTSQACPDSSWDESVKPVVSGSQEEKGDEESVETSDSGYSSSAGSSYMLNLEDKNNENNEKSPAGVVARQKSRDSNNSENGDEPVGDNTIFYKHKKFFHLRKRESSCSMSFPSTPPKQAKLADISSDTGTPVSSSTTPSVDVRCDSSENSKEVINVVDKAKPSSTEISDTKASAETEVKHVKEVTVGTGEARHNLPFVWDRTTRNHRKTK